MPGVYQINIKPEIPGERGIPKFSIPRAFVSYSGLNGDFNRWRTEEKKGEPDYALVIHSKEKLESLFCEGKRVEPGDLGENITTIGIDYDTMVPGKRYRIGKDAEIQISKVCTPCEGLKHLPYVGDKNLTAFMKALMGRRGWYAKVLKEGVIEVGSVIEELD